MILELDNTLKRVSIKIQYGTKISEFMETLTLLDLEDLEDWTIDIQYEYIFNSPYPSYIYTLGTGTGIEIESGTAKKVSYPLYTIE